MPPRPVVMGRVAAPFGVQGWVKIQPFTGEPEALLGFPTWWLGAPGSDKQDPRRVLEARRHSEYLIARLEGILSREEAAKYRGYEVSVPRQALPEAKEDEVYLEDLVGLKVVNRQGSSHGVVASVQDNGAQPVLRVVNDGAAERLIPFVPAYVLEVDLDAQRIDVDWQWDY